MKRTLAAAALLCTAALACAQPYPAKPIRLVVPYPPGGGTDTVARPLAQKISESTGQPVIVDNRGGASEIIGTEIVAHAPADGYTLLLATNAFAINLAYRRKLPYDPARDFAPVSLLITTPLMLVAHPSLPAGSLRELVALAKSQPGKLNYASLGSGTVHHLSMEWLKLVAGIDIVPVPYKGLAPALAAVTAGEVPLTFSGLTVGLGLVRSGKLRGLAVSTPARATAAPEVPSVAESGFPDYDAVAWYGVLAPAGTPVAVVARINAEIGKALGTSDLRQRFAAIGVDAAPSSPEALDQLIRKETALWTRVIQAAGLSAD
ncbi:MAG TPA: tripartite tricarboxylate transporter substrate binding protein [Burkholderiales bacterium]